MMKLIVLIPAYNEEKTIGKVIGEIPRKINGIKEIKILVVDDCSTDQTVKIAKEAKADKIISHPVNKGVGSAFSTGVEEALKMNTDILVNIDADGQFDPKDIPKLVKPILEGKADMVTCSRFLDKELEPVKMPIVKKIGNRIFTKIVNLLTLRNFTDTQCGFRAYSKGALFRLNLFGGFTYTQEVFLDLANKNLRIKEIPLEVKYIAERKSKVVSNPFTYGLKVLIIMLRTVRDYKPLEFFGGIGFFVFSIGFISGFSLFIRWILTKEVSPYRSLVNLSAVLLIIGFLLIILALMADMVGRQRKIQEEILYRLKEKKDKKRNSL